MPSAYLRNHLAFPEGNCLHPRLPQSVGKERGSGRSLRATAAPSKMEEVAMVAKIALKPCVGALICMGLLTAPNRAVAQYNKWFTVDCSGNTPGAYLSINAVL